MKELIRVKAATDVGFVDPVVWKKFNFQFFQTLDLTAIQSAITTMARSSSSSGLEYRASGGCFDCYYWRSPSTGMDLSINIAKYSTAGNSRQTTQLGWQRWAGELLRNLQHLNRHSIALIPPMRPFWQDDMTFVVVMPYGDGDASLCLREFQPLDQLIKNTLQVLEKNSFCLGDVAQVRTWQGIPFIHDFSELERI